MRSLRVEFVAGLVVMGSRLDEAFIMHVCSRCEVMGRRIAVRKAHKMVSLGSGFHLTVFDIINFIYPL